MSLAVVLTPSMIASGTSSPVLKAAIGGEISPLLPGRCVGSGKSMRHLITMAAGVAVVLGFAASAEGASSNADLAGIDRTIRGVYDVISGPPGQKRDFERMRGMFAPSALLRVITPKGIRGGSLQEYIDKSGPVLEKEGFNEREVGRRVEIYGNLASVWSAYDGRTASGSFHERGINSFQLVKVDGKWLVASILWQEEGKNFPLPRDMSRR